MFKEKNEGLKVAWTT